MTGRRRSGGGHSSPDAAGWASSGSAATTSSWTTPMRRARWSSTTRKGSSSGRPATPSRPATRSATPCRAAATTSGSTSRWAGSRSRNSRTRRCARPLRLRLRAGAAGHPPRLPGRLPRDRPANRPFYDAIDGLAACYEALGQPAEAAGLRTPGRRGSRPARGGPRAAPGPAPRPSTGPPAEHPRHDRPGSAPCDEAVSLAVRAVFDFNGFFGLRRIRERDRTAAVRDSAEGVAPTRPGEQAGVENSGRGR